MGDARSGKNHRRPRVAVALGAGGRLHARMVDITMLDHDEGLSDLVARSDPLVANESDSPSSCLRANGQVLQGDIAARSRGLTTPTLTRPACGRIMLQQCYPLAQSAMT